MSKYIVLDLEMCRIPKGIKHETFKSSRELIQIGAVELNESYQITKTFMTYVKPEFGILDSTICRLTGISDHDTQFAPIAKDALNAFLNWLPEDAVLVTWSVNDINQIDDELYFKNIDLPDLYDYLDNYIDCQVLFSEKMNRDKLYNLKEALSIANVDYDTNIHDALVDAKNTALLFSKIQTEDRLVLSPYYISQEDIMRYRSSYVYC